VARIDAQGIRLVVDIPAMPKFPPLEKDPFDTDDEIQQLSKVSGQSVTGQARQQLVARDPSFDDTSFLDQAKATFMTLQKARADRNLESFRTQLTDLMYNQWKARTDALAARHRRTVLTRLDIESASIARILVESDADIITVVFEGTVIIGDQDQRSGRWPTGTPTPDGFTEYWTFVRHPGNPIWLLDEVGGPADWRLAS
jgi:predicted lipid-binding transport protein (Tim44 family)